MEFNIVQNLLKGQSLQHPPIHSRLGFAMCFTRRSEQWYNEKASICCVSWAADSDPLDLRLQFPIVALLRGVKLRMTLK